MVKILAMFFVTHAASLEAASPPSARPREGVAVSGPGNRHRRAREACPFHRQSSAAQQTISRRHSRSSGRPPRAEERRSAGGPPRNQLRPRGAPLRPDSRNDQDRGSTSNRGGEGHPRRESSSHTSTGTSSGSSPAARGQPHPAAASSTATQTSEPTVETTNHQTSSTRAERARRWRKRVSPYGRATSYGGYGVGRPGGYERDLERHRRHASAGSGRKLHQVGSGAGMRAAAESSQARADRQAKEPVRPRALARMGRAANGHTTGQASAARRREGRTQLAGRLRARIVTARKERGGAAGVFPSLVACFCQLWRRPHPWRAGSVKLRVMERRTERRV